MVSHISPDHCTAISHMCPIHWQKNMTLDLLPILRARSAPTIVHISLMRIWTVVLITVLQNQISILFSSVPTWYCVGNTNLDQNCIWYGRNPTHHPVHMMI